MRIYEAVLPDFEFVDSATPTRDQATYEKDRDLVWRAFTEALKREATHSDRMILAVIVLGELIDAPELDPNILLAALKRAVERPR